MDTIDMKKHVIVRFYQSRGDHDKAARVAAYGYGNRCKVRHCPICEHTRARGRFTTLGNTYTDLWNQHPRMQQPQFVTMTTGDTPVEFIGSTVQVPNASSSMALSSVKTYAWYRQVEVVPAHSGTTHANVHAHGVLFLPQRESVTPEQLYRAWSQALTSTNAFVTARDLTIEGPRTGLEEALQYTTKAEQPSKMTDPETGGFDANFFTVYSDQTRRKHMHRLVRTPCREELDT